LFHNSNVFGSCIIHILYKGCAKIKKNKRLILNIESGWFILYGYITIHGKQNFKSLVTMLQNYAQKKLLLYLQLHASLQNAGDALSETNMVTKIGIVPCTQQQQQQHVL